MAENRGRPSESVVKLDKWTLDTGDTVYYYDRKKSENGCWKVVNNDTTRHPKPKIEQRLYHRSCPTVILFKTSNRSNAKTKMKVINKNIDYVLSAKKIPGIPEIAEWLEVGVGTSFVNKYKQKYNLA